MTGRPWRSPPGRRLHGALAALALGAVLSLSHGAAVVNAAEPKSASRGEQEMLSLGGRQVAASELVGRAVFGPDGARIGEVADLIQRDNTYNEVVIKLEEENRQMGVVAGSSDAKLPAKPEGEPVVLGGTTVAVPLESLQARDDGGLTIDPDALRTVAEFEYSDSGRYWSDLNGRPRAR